MDRPGGLTKLMDQPLETPAPDATPSGILLSRDLIFTAKVTGTAQMLGRRVLVAGDRAVAEIARSTPARRKGRRGLGAASCGVGRGAEGLGKRLPGAQGRAEGLRRGNQGVEHRPVAGAGAAEFGDRHAASMEGGSPGL